MPDFAATRDNYTTYFRGLNRIIIDVDFLSATELTTADFIFRAGNSSNISTFVPAPDPVRLTLLVEVVSMDRHGSS